MEIDTSIDSWKAKSIWLARENKTPRSAIDGSAGASNNPKTWGTYDQAKKTAERCNLSGIGIVLGPDGLSGLDLDHVRNSGSGEITPQAREIIEFMDSYTEISPSGTGFHILFVCDSSEYIGNKFPMKEWKNPYDTEGCAIEIYHPIFKDNKNEHGRYFTFTERVFENRSEIKNCTKKIFELFKKYNLEISKSPIFNEKPPISIENPIEVFDSRPIGEIVDNLRHSKYGSRFDQLYSGDDLHNGDASANDYDFCCICARETQDPQIIYEIVKTSKLKNLEDKWINRADYRDRTITKAIQTIRAERVSDLQPFPRYENGERAHERVGDAIIQELDVKKINGKIYSFKGGVYVPCENEDFNPIHKYLVEKYVTTKNIRNEVLAYMKDKIAENVKIPVQNTIKFINFKNGLFNLETGNLEPHTPDVITINQIPHNYIRGKKSEKLDKFLNDVFRGNQELISLIKHITGYMMIQNNITRKAFFLTGDGKNGKSSLLALMKNIIGLENSANLDPKYFDTSKYRFQIAEIVGKLANLCDDISSEYLKDTSIFKTMISTERIESERKGLDRKPFMPYCTSIFSVNQMPRIAHGEKSITDRIVIIPFEARFEKDDPSIKTLMLHDEDIAEAMISYAIDELMTKGHNGNLTIPQICTDKLNSYAQECDSVRTYLEERTTDLGRDLIDSVIGFTRGQLFKEYKDYCFDNGYTGVNSTTFGKRILELIPEVENKPMNRYDETGKRTKTRVYVKK